MDVDDFIERNYKVGSYFIVPRDLIDGTYPKDFLTVEEVLLLLLIYRYRDESRVSKLGKVTIGVQAYDKHIRPIRNKGKGAKAELEKAIRPLVKKEFLFPITAAKLSLQYAIALPPLYDSVSKTPVSYYPGEEYTNVNIISRKLPFIRLPCCLIDNNIITPRNKNLLLNINHINALLLFYRLNWIETYGGVDMAFIHKIKGQLKVHQSVYMNLNINTDIEKQAFENTLIHLERMGLIIWVEIVAEKNKFICDCNLFNQNKLTAKHKVVQIIRPFFQPLLMKEKNKP